MIKSAQIKSGGMKKKSQKDLSAPQKSLINNAQNQKNKKPNIGGHHGPFCKSIPRSRNLWTKKEFGI
jgi:hypothetical protein